MQPLSRAAVLLTASALTLGMSATTATADTPTPRPAPGVSATPVGGEFAAGPDKDTGKDRASDRRVARLTKALARARAERADAYNAAAAAKSTLSDAQIVANDSQVAVLAATEAVHEAKADLAEARTHLNHTRTVVKDATDLLAQNHTAQDTATAAITAATDARDAATTTAADLTAAMPALTAARDTAAQDVANADNEIATLTTVTIPQATTDAENAQAAVDALIPQVQSALDLYTERTWAYFECHPQPNGEVNCLDFTYNWMVRSEVTHPWGIYLDLLDQQTQAQDVADDAATTLTGLHADLEYWTTRTPVLTAAQEALDTAQADLVAANAAHTTAVDEIVEQETLLDTLTVNAVALVEALDAAKTNETHAAGADAKRATALAAATTVLDDATTANKAHRANQDRAHQSLNDAYRTLTKTQDTARRIKDRLHKARAHKARQHNR